MVEEGRAAKPSSKALLKKQRVIAYFIEAAKEIANESGIESITIRNVSERAGYYSASLYNYFDNLEQLLAFTAIDLESDYLNRLIDIYSSDANSLERFILSWKSYGIYSYGNKSIYAYIYNSSNSDYIASCYKNYLEVFPRKFANLPPKTVEMFLIPSFHGQDQFIVRECVDDGYFRADDIKRIIDISTVLHDGLLWQAMEQDIDKTPEYYTHEFMKHFINFLKTVMIKDVDLSMYL